MKTFVILTCAIALLLIGGLIWSKNLQKNDPDTISLNGIHWHPVLNIYVNDELQSIPANIGLGAVHNPIHTHDEDAKDGVIHLEFPGVVKYKDTRLGEFFRVWNKDIKSFGPNVAMTVNGVKNTEHENYLMRDRDKIELRYNWSK